ncbi:hypothetical protein KPSA3_05420 [Pseudomonas syringae pv. actinidiae]|uniref:Uncharacterized protein n=1 Tax=Pseudomonas syringae pv. actinidiae TaxID=103796 RepID=A0AAN4TN30_PSESF|nr:hypothetical protein KPSA3_05420 [Pseudomonas syringae pv. actinidiae]
MGGILPDFVSGFVSRFALRCDRYQQGFHSSGSLALTSHPAM